MQKLWLLILVLLVAGCSAEIANEKPLIVTTTGMIGDIALNLAGDSARVISLMGPGTDPHLFKASAGDVARLRNADLILYNGLHLEGKMIDVLEELAQRKPVVPITEGISPSKLVSVEAGMHDPHIWFDVNLWQEATIRVYTEMQQLFADDTSLLNDLEINFNIYNEQLEKLDQDVHALFLSIPESKRVLITAHDAFGYLGKAYGLEVMGLQGISTVSEAGVSDVRSLADFIADREIPAVFVESSVPRKSIEALQAAVRERGFDVSIGGELFSDAMGEGGTVEGTYIGMVRHNAETIAHALSGK